MPRSQPQELEQQPLPQTVGQLKRLLEELQKHDKEKEKKKTSTDKQGESEPPTWDFEQCSVMVSKVVPLKKRNETKEMRSLCLANLHCQECRFQVNDSNAHFVTIEDRTFYTLHSVKDSVDQPDMNYEACFVSHMVVQVEMSDSDYKSMVEKVEQKQPLVVSRDDLEMTVHWVYASSQLSRSDRRLWSKLPETKDSPWLWTRDYVLHQPDMTYRIQAAIPEDQVERIHYIYQGDQPKETRFEKIGFIIPWTTIDEDDIAVIESDDEEKEEEEEEEEPGLRRKNRKRKRLRTLYDEDEANGEEGKEGKEETSTSKKAKTAQPAQAVLHLDDQNGEEEEGGKEDEEEEEEEDEEEDEKEEKEEICEIDCIESYRVNRRGQREYCVKWRGYPSSKNQWLLSTAFTDQVLIKAYHKEVLGEEEDDEEEDEEEDEREEGEEKHEMPLFSSSASLLTSTQRQSHAATKQEFERFLQAEESMAVHTPWFQYMLRTDLFKALDIGRDVCGAPGRSILLLMTHKPQLYRSRESVICTCHLCGEKRTCVYRMQLPFVMDEKKKEGEHEEEEGGKDLFPWYLLSVYGTEWRRQAGATFHQRVAHFGEGEGKSHNKSLSKRSHLPFPMIGKRCFEKCERYLAMVKRLQTQRVQYRALFDTSASSLSTTTTQLPGTHMKSGSFSQLHNRLQQLVQAFVDREWYFWCEADEAHEARESG